MPTTRKERPEQHACGEVLGAEHQRLTELREGTAAWDLWGPYLAERQWGTVREDYSADGSAWQYVSDDHARSRACRWGEDGLLGISDRDGQLGFALALWNGRDPILCTGTRRACSMIRTSAITYCSTSTSTATPVAASALHIKPDGPV